MANNIFISRWVQSVLQKHSQAFHIDCGVFLFINIDHFIGVVSSLNSEHYTVEYTVPIRFRAIDYTSAHSTFLENFKLLQTCRLWWHISNWTETTTITTLFKLYLFFSPLLSFQCEYYALLVNLILVDCLRSWRWNSLL